MTHGVLGLVGAVCGSSLYDILLPPLLLGSFSFFSFFSLSTWFFAFSALPSEEEGSEEELDEVEALRETWGLSSY